MTPNVSRGAHRSAIVVAFMLPITALVTSSWPDDFRHGRHGQHGRVIVLHVGAGVVRELAITERSTLTIRLPAYQGDRDWCESTGPIKSVDAGSITLSVADPMALLRAGSAIELVSVENPPPAKTRTELLAEAYARRRLAFLKGPQ